MAEGALEQGPSWVRDRDELATELRYFTRHHEWNPSEEVLATIIEWHLAAVAAARGDMWLPGMARCRDPLVEEVLNRYYGQQMRAEMTRLLQENMGLKKHLLDVLAGIRFYAMAGADNGVCAKAALESLLAAGLRSDKGEVLAMGRPYRTR